MPTRKKAPNKASSSKATSAIKGGAVPPYGIAIRDAIARGDSQQMREIAVSSRKYLKDVQSALDMLEKALSSRLR